MGFGWFCCAGIHFYRLQKCRSAELGGVRHGQVGLESGNCGGAHVCFAEKYTTR